MPASGSRRQWVTRALARPAGSGMFCERLPAGALMARAVLAGLLLVAAFQAPATAQARATADSVVVPLSPFRPLPLPAPNDYRTGSGRPGPRYWQQRADY